MLAMWYLLYNILLILASPFIAVILLAKKRCRPGLPERLGLFGLSGLFRLVGHNGPNRLNRPNGPTLWVHAVSLGEVVAAVPLARLLHSQYPEYQLVVSTVTDTGREAVEQRLAGVAEHCYAPLDFPWVVSRVVERLDPTAFLFVETELWPNLLRALSRRGVPSILINGRLSSESFRGYKLVRPLISRVLGTVTFCLMQSERDAERVVALGAAPARVLRTGNMKFDQPVPGPAEQQKSLSRRELGLAEHEELIVAGSTHPGEEEQLLSCYQILLREFPSLVLLLAPRHVERAAAVEAVVRSKGLVALRRSGFRELGVTSRGPVAAKSNGYPEQRVPSAPRVVILDTRGELAALYQHAVLTFVGGTLIPVGGHNLLEPAVWSKPVYFGPHTDHCAEVAELLIRAGGAVQVRDGVELAAEMARLLRDRAGLQQVGAAARGVVVENQGAVERCLEVIGRVLGSRGRPDEKLLVGQSSHAAGMAKVER